MQVSSKRLALFALIIAMALWAAKATLAVSLKGLPPFLMTGLTLMIGGSLSLTSVKNWTLSIRAVAIGVYGIFVYHFFYFLALRSAPPVEANLIHYLWPDLIVVLTPVFSKGEHIRWNHCVGVLCGLTGATLAATHGNALTIDSFQTGYIYAFIAAIVWATYSLLLKWLHGYSTSTTGAICIISGAMALVCHALYEPTVQISSSQWFLVILLGIGPMGIAFYLWDYGMRHGDSKITGTLSYGTPVLSTLLLSYVTGRSIGSTLILATALIIVGGVIGMLPKKRKVELAYED